MSVVPPPGPYGPPGYGSPVPGSMPGSMPLAEGRKPVGAAGYWIGAVLVVAGLILGIVLIVVGISRAVDAFSFPDVADSSGGVWIDDPGGKVLFIIEPEYATSPYRPQVTVTVTDPTGDPVPTSTYEGTRSTTGFDPVTGTSQQATAVATFEARETGRYHLSVASLDGTVTQGLPGLGVGDGVGGGFGLLGLGMVGAGLAVVTGIVLLIVTAVRRSRQHRPTSYPGAPPGMVAPYPRYPYPSPGSLVPPAPARPPQPWRTPVPQPPVAPAGNWWDRPGPGPMSPPVGDGDPSGTWPQYPN